MIKNTNPAANVVATSPFLTIEQAAAELNIEPIDLLRLIARKRMTGSPAGKDHWKITPHELAAYVAGGSPDLKAPGWDTKQDRPLDYDAQSQTEALRRIVAKAMEAIAPAELSGVTKTREGRYPSTFISLRAATILPLLSEPHTPLVRLPNSESSRYGSRGLAYSVNGLRGGVMGLLSRELTVRDAANPRTMRERLFASPEEFDRITVAGWRAFLESGFQMSRNYPGEKPGDGPVRLIFRVSHADLKFDFKNAVELAF